MVTRPTLAVLVALDGLAVVAGVLAQVGESDTAGAIADAGDLVGLLNYGILGILFVLWLRRSIRTAGEVAEADARTTKAESRAEAAEARERALYESIRSDVVPAMTRITDRLTAGKA